MHLEKTMHFVSGISPGSWYNIEKHLHRETQESCSIFFGFNISSRFVKHRGYNEKI